MSSLPRMRWFVFSILVALLGIAATAGPAEAGVASLRIESEPGDFIGDGKRYYHRPSDGTFSSALWGAVTGTAVDITFRPPTFPFGENWRLAFAAPGGAPLTVGTYSGAAAHPFQAADVPGLNISGMGRGCNSITGSFVVHEVTYTGDTVTALWVTFEQHCDGQEAALRGDLRYNASAPVHLTVPEPFTVADGDLLSFSYSADGAGPLILTGEEQPAGALVTDHGDSTATATWTPSPTQLGTFGLEVRAENGSGDAHSAYVFVTVTAAHDDLESARSLTASFPAGSFEGSFDGTTVADGEPGASWGRSVWFTFVAPATERLVFELANDEWQATVQLYQRIDAGQAVVCEPRSHPSWPERRHGRA